MTSGYYFDRIILSMELYYNGLRELNRRLKSITKVDNHETTNPEPLSRPKPRLVGEAFSALSKRLAEDRAQAKTETGRDEYNSLIKEAKNHLTAMRRSLPATFLEEKRRDLNRLKI